MFDQPLLLDMIFLGTPQLCGGVDILFFFKVSFEKHPSVHLHAVTIVIAAKAVADTRAVTAAYYVGTF